MVAAVKSRPNHYEVLGLSPAASSTEIAQAFARELNFLGLRPVERLAEVSVAYATLRDPTKRGAYDASLRAEPETQASRLIERLQSAPVLGRPAPLHEKASAVEAPLAPLGPSTEPAKTTFVTAPPPQPILPKSPTAQAAARPLDEPVRPAEAARPRPEPEPGFLTALYFEEMDRARDSSRGSNAWKLPALAAGALILAVGVGAWMGLDAGSGGDSAQSKPEDALNIVSAKLPPAIAAEPVPTVEEVRPEPRARATVATTRVTRSRPAPQPAEVAEAQPDTTEQQSIEAAATEQPAVEAPAAAPAAAKMPLPNSVIARTIGRIGYACGEVASVSATDQPAVFTVTCTSGHSYRASPVRGRYHFKRLAGR